MVTATLIKKLNKEVNELKSDVRQMKRFLFVPFKDSEGKYRKSFIKKIVNRAGSVGPFYKFANKELFLSHVRSEK